jgi:hypothetical protein
MQLSGSFLQSVLHLKRSQASQPMGGVRASPLSRPWAAWAAHRATRAKAAAAIRSATRQQIDWKSPPIRLESFSGIFSRPLSFSAAREQFVSLRNSCSRARRALPDLHTPPIHTHTSSICVYMHAARSFTFVICSCCGFSLKLLNPPTGNNCDSALSFLIVLLQPVASLCNCNKITRRLVFTKALQNAFG